MVGGSIDWVLSQDKGGVVEQCKASEEQSALDSSKGTFIRSRPIDPRLKKIPRTQRSASQTECLGVSGQLSNCLTQYVRMLLCCNHSRKRKDSFIVLVNARPGTFDFLDYFTIT